MSGVLVKDDKDVTIAPAFKGKIDDFTVNIISSQHLEEPVIGEVPPKVEELYNKALTLIDAHEVN